MPLSAVSGRTSGRSSVVGAIRKVRAGVVPAMVSVCGAPRKSCASLDTFTASVPPLQSERIQCTRARDHASVPGVVG